MHPQLTIAMAKANQDEFLRRAAIHSRSQREARTSPIGALRPKLTALLHRSNRPLVGRVAGAKV